jgi:hypothetical protein
MLTPDQNVKYKVMASGRASGKSYMQMIYLLSYAYEWQYYHLFEQEENEIKDLEAYDRLHDQIDR